jgi:hypothetical protein
MSHKYICKIELIIGSRMHVGRRKREKFLFFEGFIECDHLPPIIGNPFILQNAHKKMKFKIPELQLSEKCE